MFTDLEIYLLYVVGILLLYCITMTYIAHYWKTIAEDWLDRFNKAAYKSVHTTQQGNDNDE